MPTWRERWLYSIASVLWCWPWRMQWISNDITQRQLHNVFLFKDFVKSYKVIRKSPWCHIEEYLWIFHISYLFPREVQGRLRCSRAWDGASLRFHPAVRCYGCTTRCRFFGGEFHNAFEAEKEGHGRHSLLRRSGKCGSQEVHPPWSCSATPWATIPLNFP